MTEYWESRFKNEGAMWQFEPSDSVLKEFGEFGIIECIDLEEPVKFVDGEEPVKMKFIICKKQEKHS
jgi:hypothetical protein